MTKQMFEEENVEKKSNQTKLTCRACGCKFIDDFWHKRCKACRDAKKPLVKRLAPKGLTFTGRTYPSGKPGVPDYPSVTSIIHPEGIDYPKYKLDQYAARGTIVHTLIEEYYKADCLHWFDPHDIPELAEKVKIVENGSLKLKWTDCDYLGFVKKYHKDFKMHAFEQLVVNHEHKYGGRYDAYGLYKGEKAIIDFKTASVYSTEKLDSYFTQLSAYAEMVDGIEKLVIIPLNPKKGFEAPYVSSKIDKHFADFLKLREEFNTMYNL